ncbi:MAG: hypothetical protein BGO67_07670 [Alphaproteobacteria bacterium 41-28]|nr:MAG: hypothetical protein BGO67_07670 [Alphaproteobacteria bacterium 41-28]
MVNFKKNLTSALVLLSLMSVSNAIAMENDADDFRGETVRSFSHMNYKNLMAIGASYVDFLKEIGESGAPVTQKRVSRLFAPECKKIENGTTLFTQSSMLPAQMNNAREAVGKWTLETLWSAADTVQNICTIHFKWEGENMGPHTTMVGLCVNDKGKIFEVREVYNEWQKKTLGTQEN